MTSTNEVYRKIKEISLRTANPRPPINIQAMAQEMQLRRDDILPHLQELKEMRLVQIDSNRYVQVKLTLLGTTVNR